MTCITVSARGDAPRAGQVDHQMAARCIERMAAVVRDGHLGQLGELGGLRLFLADTWLLARVTIGYSDDDCAEIAWRLWCQGVAA